MKLHQLLKIRRTEVGLSQEQAAVAIGTTRLTYSRWEKGLAVPDPKWFDALADWLGRPTWRVVAATGLLDEAATSVLEEHLGGYLVPIAA